MFSTTEDATLLHNAWQPHIGNTRRIRWSWFPSLFFGDGMLPSVIILSMLMLHRFGLNNAQTALYVSLLCTLFILRPLFEMAVTHFRDTTKVWILSSEFISALSLWAIAFTLPTRYWLQSTMSLLPFYIVSGIFYNIATYRFYTDTTPAAPIMQNTMAMLFRSMAMLFGTGAVAMLAGNMEVLTRNIRYSWSLAFYVMAGVEFVLWLWHSIFLPGNKHCTTTAKNLKGLNLSEYSNALDRTLHGWQNRLTLYFMVFFTLPEAFLSAVAMLFVVDAPHNGGLGLSPQEFAFAIGTIGVMTFFVGKTAATVLLKRLSLRMMAIPMSAVMTLHGASVLYISYNLSASFTAICMILSVGYAALGFASAIYQPVIQQFMQNSCEPTFRRSIALSVIAITIVTAVLSTGLLQQYIGYRQFFIMGTTSYIISVIISALYTIFIKNYLPLQQNINKK